MSFDCCSFIEILVFVVPRQFRRRAPPTGPTCGWTVPLCVARSLWEREEVFCAGGDVTLLLVTVPLYLLYEVSIIVARKVEKFRGNCDFDAWKFRGNEGKSYLCTWNQVVSIYIGSEKSADHRLPHAAHTVRTKRHAVWLQCRFAISITESGLHRLTQMDVRRRRGGALIVNG